MMKCNEAGLQDTPSRESAALDKAQTPEGGTNELELIEQWLPSFLAILTTRCLSYVWQH
jgi:hypothetical protein